MTEHSLRLERTYEAPVERVWAAWTDPELLAQWFCPNPELVLEVDADARVGGALRVVMGGTYALSGTYTEVDAPRLLEFTWRWDHEEDSTLVRVELEPTASGSRLVLQHSGFPDAAEADGHTEGWELELDRLVPLLEEA